MTRHILVTLLIFAVIYAGLLYVNEPLMTDIESQQVQSVPAPVDTPAAASEGETEPVELATKPVKPQAAPKPVFVKPSPEPVMPEFAARTLVGVAARINLDHAAEEVAALWQRFNAKKALHNNADWSQGKLPVYAYFHNFSNDLSRVELFIGYDRQSLLLDSDAPRVTTVGGSYRQYPFNAAQNTADNEAWAAAFRNANMIERHMLNLRGQVTGTQVFVIQQ